MFGGGLRMFETWFRKSQTASPYVMLSRLKSFDGLLILDMDDDDETVLKYLNVPVSKDLTCDMKRLDALHKKCMKYCKTKWKSPKTQPFPLLRMKNKLQDANKIHFNAHMGT